MKKFLSVSAMALLPVIAFAQVQGTPQVGQGSQIGQLFDFVNDIANWFIPFATTLAVIYFIFEVGKYVVAADDKAKGEARKGMINGAIALFVVVSIWGIIRFIGTTVGVDQGGTNCIIDPNGPNC
jgi:hypothetical protein